MSRQKKKEKKVRHCIDFDELDEEATKIEQEAHDRIERIKHTLVYLKKDWCETAFLVWFGFAVVVSFILSFFITPLALGQYLTTEVVIIVLFYILIGSELLVAVTYLSKKISAEYDFGAMLFLKATGFGIAFFGLFVASILGLFIQNMFVAFLMILGSNGTLISGGLIVLLVLNFLNKKYLEGVDAEIEIEAFRQEQKRREWW